MSACGHLGRVAPDSSAHYGRHEEPPSCLMVIEPVDPKHPLTIIPGLTGSLLRPGESVNNGTGGQCR